MGKEIKTEGGKMHGGLDTRTVAAVLEAGDAENLPMGGFEKNLRTSRRPEERPGKNKTPRRREISMVSESRLVVVLPVIKSPETEGIEMQSPAETKQGDQIEMRAVWPRIQAVVNQVMEIPNTDTCRVEIHKAEGQTFLTLMPNRQTGVATVPEGISPNRWQLTAAFVVKKGLADGISFIQNGIATSIKSYRTIPGNDKMPTLRLYNFCRTVGPTTRALTLQVSKDKKCLVQEWAISVLDGKSAKRALEATLLNNEWLPLNDLERTKKALPATLVPLAQELCFLFDRACGKPMPVKEARPALARTVSQP